MNRLIKYLFFISFIVLHTKSKSFIISDCMPAVKERIGVYDVECKLKTDDYYLIINCHHHNLSNLNDIKINLHFVSELTFLYCIFTNTTNLQSLVHSLNLKFKTIVFENFGDSLHRLNFQNLSTRELYLSHSNIHELSFDLFHNVLDIRALYLFYTNIARIPTAFFSVWAKDLLKLELSRNNLRKIAKDDFTHLINLVELELYGNQIDEIESGAFDNLSLLENLDLSSNQFHTLPSNIFHRLTALTNIDLSFFPRLRDIQKLTDDKYLAMSQLKNLAPDVFKGIFELRTIEFRGQNLQNLPLGLFADHKNLENLSLIRNNIKYLPAGIFKELKNLKRLVLDENQLTTLVPDFFIELHSLQDFHVSRNNLTKIDTHLMMQSKSLRYIDLAFNKISAIQHLDGRNLFTNVTGRPNFQQRLVMNLSYNSFTEFNVDLVDLRTKIQVIDLRNNKISKINLGKMSDADVKGKIGYVSIYLANNPLHCDCHLMNFINYFHESSNYKSLIISAGDKSDFSKELKCYSPPELKSREVRKIHLQELHCLLQSNVVGDACHEVCICQEYPGIQVLSADCSFRNLIQLPIMIGNVHNSSIELNMSGNALKNTPSLKHSYLIAVTKLDLSSNNITEVSLDTFSPALQELKLHNNSISRLNKAIIEYLARDNSLRSLTIHENKWICDCETHRLLRSFNRKKLFSYNINEMLCYGTNRTIYDIAESEVCEDTQISNVVASSLIAFFGIFVGCLAGFYYRYQQQIKIWLYSRQLCLRFITDDELDKDKQYDAFISFSHKDEDFVEKEIVAKLEEGPRPYKLCLHYRDWLAGEWIPLQISRSVADSRRTVIILTPNFLKSVWGLVEFRTAYTQALKDGRSRLIVILYGEMGNIDDLDQELRDYLSLNTYIKWGDPWFWQKLKYALPHSLLNSKKVANFNPVSYRVTSNKNGGETDDGKVLRI